MPATTQDNPNIMKRRRGKGDDFNEVRVDGGLERRCNTKLGRTNNVTTICLLAGSLHHQISGYSGCFAAEFPYAPGRDGIDRLPQRRVRTPTRAVGYPADHPLSRHLLDGALRRDDSEDGRRIGEDEVETEEHASPVGDLPTASPSSPPPPLPEPIRIVPILTRTTQSHLTKSQQHYLLHTVLRPAIEAWSDAIRLIRVEGNLTLDRSQLWDGVSCGPGQDENGTPSALPPAHHFHDFGAMAANNKTKSDGGAGGGVGVPNADLVVYVELGFREKQQDTRSASIDSASSTSRHDIDSFSKTNEHPGAGNIRGSDVLYKNAGFESIPQQISENFESSASSAGSNSNATFSSANGLVDATHPSLSNLIPPETSTASLLASKAPASGTIQYPRCSPAYLASATHCSTDQYDRPTHGMIHLCIDPDTFFTSSTDDIKHLQLTQLTVMHELGHLLGFNLQSLAHFRERDGKPRTPRLPASSSAAHEIDQSPWVVGEVPDVNVECTGILNKRNRRRKATIPLPAETTLKFRTIRGGVRVADIVTPTVQAVVRNHFSCDSLEGAELEGERYRVERLKGSPLHGLTPTSPRQSEDEVDSTEAGDSLSEKNDRQRHLYGTNDYHDDVEGRDRRSDYDYLDNGAGDQVGDTLAAEDIQYYNAEADVGACIEDHWSRRIFKNDLMNPVITDLPLPRPESLVLSSSEATTSLLPAISPLTLAYFSDSGWYDVDYSKASSSSGPWGRGAGCPFVNEKCIMGNGKVRAANSAFFCNDPRALLPAAELSPDGQQGVGSMRGSAYSIKMPRDAIEWTGCSDDGLRKASCNMVRYAKSLPEEFSYFSSTPTFLKHKMSPPERQSVGGPDVSLDYCPFHSIPHVEDDESDITLCTSPKSARHRIKDMEDFGPGARCVTGHVNGQKAALCVSVACVLSDQSLRVKVDGVWQICQFPGQVLSVWPHDAVICPDIRIMCPTFYCPRDCLGTGGIDEEGNAIGICDGETGQCMCPDLSQAPSASPTSITNEPTSMVTFRSTESGDDGPDLSDEMPKTIRGEENEERNSDEAHDLTRKSMVPCQRAYLVNSVDMNRRHWPWMKSSLSDIYVQRPKHLVDTPVDIFTRTFRVFSSMSTGDVIGFLAISVVVVLGAGIGGMGAVKAYKRNARNRINESSDDGNSSSVDGQIGRSHFNFPFGTAEARVPSYPPRTFAVSSLETARFRLNLGATRLSSASNSSRHRRHVDRRLRSRNSFRTNKDKAVATMLVDLRLNNPAQKSRRQRRRDILLRRQQRRRREIQERVRHLPMRSMARFQAPPVSFGESVVRHSDLPPLPEGNGRVVAVVGALFIDDVPDDDAGSDYVDDASLPDTETSGHITNTTAACGDCTSNRSGEKKPDDDVDDEENLSLYDEVNAQ